MTLVTRFLAARRDKLLMRLGCWLVCFSLILGLMLPQQRAEAAAATVGLTGAVAVVCAYFCACGLKFVVSGVQEAGLTDFVSRLFGEYAVATNMSLVPGPDDDPNLPPLLLWLGPNFVTRSPIGQLLLTRAVVMKLVDFAQWVAQQYGTQVGPNVIYSGEALSLEVNGILQSFSLTSYAKNSAGRNQIVALGTVIPVGSSASDPVILRVPGTNNSFYTYWSGVNFVIGFSSGNSSVSHMSFPSSDGKYIRYHADTLTFTVNENGALTVGAYDTFWNEYFFNVSFDVSYGESSLSIDRAPSMSYIPDDIAADQGIALDVGAAATMDLDLVLGGVLDDVLAGTLDSTMTAAGEAVVTPPAGEITDVDNLGLPALGAALTSRFPFSIPWDFFRAVQLLAAPAKAPYFEVDFMEPIEYRVGQWQGSTKIVLDFSEYAIIGQVSRWTSTIGFCLTLAVWTKRLVWTA